MWIEDEIQKDVIGLQKTMQDLRRDYTAQLPRSIRSHIPEKKELTTDFFNTFYDKLRNAEYEMYQIFTKDVNKPKDPIQSETCETKLAYHITEIKNSANDLDCSVPMICDATIITVVMMTSIFHTRYIHIFERNPSFVSILRQSFMGVKYHFIL